MPRNLDPEFSTLVVPHFFLGYLPQRGSWVVGCFCDLPGQQLSQCSGFMGKDLVIKFRHLDLIRLTVSADSCNTAPVPGWNSSFRPGIICQS